MKSSSSVMAARIWIPAMLAGAAFGCTSQSDLDEIKRNQALLKSNANDIKQNQRTIIAKLEAIEQRLSEARPGAPAAPAQNRGNGPDPQAVYAFPIGDSPIRGAKDAWVTVVEVSEFQCPFCARVGPTLEQLRTKYGNDIRFVFKHNPLPFHSQAMPAAIAAECAREQGKFWEFHDEAFRNQNNLEDNALESYAGTAGVDRAKWSECFQADRHKDRVAADQQTAAALGAHGTPAFFVNGRYLNGAQGMDVFSRLIDEELAKAQASGIPRADYYEKQVMAVGKKST